jgi:Cu2+-exporting ATPase
MGAAVPAHLQRCEHELARRGVSPVLVAVDRQVAAVAGVGDALRDGAPAAVDALQRLGWTVGVLSGDDPQVVAAVTAALPVDPGACHGGASPEEKLAAVRDAARRQPVVMVGDGVNDAAALAAATVGVAVRGGAEASLAAADVFLARGGLDGLVELAQGARRTMTVIRRNLAVSLVYNVLGASLAMAGVINPLVAAVLMPLSSLTVVTLSFRSRTFR